MAPIPPAFAIAIERLTGHAPALGASRIGMPSPYLAENSAARSLGRVVTVGRLYALANGSVKPEAL
jgi:hypothetical protein